MNHLIQPYGGSLVALTVGEGRARQLRLASRDWPSHDLDPRQLSDLELLLSGGYSPLDGFMGRADHEAVCRNMRLANGVLWPVPITLDIPEDLAERLSVGDRLALRDPEGVMLAAMTIAEVWEPDREAERDALYGSGIRSGGTPPPLGPRYAVAGAIEGVQLPVHHDYRELRLTPVELRRWFARLGWRRVLAFQTHQTMHRAQQWLTQRTALDSGANLLLHPLVGSTRSGDPDHYTRVRCYQELLAHYPKDMARLNLLPLTSRGAGPREAVLEGIVHRNFGCSHLMVEYDLAGAVLETAGGPLYDPAEARQLVDRHRDELGIEVMPFRDVVFLERRAEFVCADDAPADDRPLRVSGAEVRERLAHGRELPEWFTFPGVERELRRRHPPRHSQGFTVFFTGLSGAGKSTVANALRVKLMEIGGRGVSLLDGDLVRKNLSSELGFTREHRDLNIHRIGFVSAEITRAGGVAICAPIAPYDAVRRQVRSMVEPWGGFVLVHVATPLEVCEARDRKGMYAKARAGIVKEFTGISDPYEEPTDAEVTLDTSAVTPEEATREVLLFLERQGYISAVRG